MTVTKAFPAVAVVLAFVAVAALQPKRLCASVRANTTGVNSIRFADQFSGADWCAKVTAADSDLGAGPGEIWVDLAAGNAACATAPILSAQHVLRFVQGGSYKLADGFAPGTGSKILGIGGGPAQSAATPAGVVLQYNGSTPNTAVISVYSTNNFVMDGISVDCNSVSGTVGIRYWSNASPGSSGAQFTHGSTYNCHQGFVNGDPGDASGVYTAQADSFEIKNFYFYGNGADPSAEGIHINGTNVAQQSVIDRVYFSQLNRGVHVVQTNGGLEIRNSGPLGSAVGISPTLFVFDVSVWGPISLVNNEMEGSNMAVHDSSCPSGGTHSSMEMRTNQFFNGASTAVLVDGCSYWTSTANTGFDGSWKLNNSMAYVDSRGESSALWSATAGFVDYAYGARSFAGKVQFKGGISSDGKDGLSTTKTIRGADGNSCTFIFTRGILTDTTCP